MATNSTRIEQRLAAIASRGAVVAEPAPRARENARAEPRRPVFRFAQIELSDRTTLNCIVKDISAGGARVVLDGGETLPQWVKLRIAITGELKRARVCWQRDRSAGLSFHANEKMSFGETTSLRG